jgi:hypothetical protein
MFKLQSSIMAYQYSVIKVPTHQLESLNLNHFDGQPAKQWDILQLALVMHGGLEVLWLC